MRFVIQRVMHSKVTINGEVRGQIGKGFMVLIGVGEEDTVEIADKMILKWLICVFSKMKTVRRSWSEGGGRKSSAYFPFTLYADCKRGNNLPL